MEDCEMIVFKILAFLPSVALLENDLLHEKYGVCAIDIFCIYFQHNCKEKYVNFPSELRVNW